MPAVGSSNAVDSMFNGALSGAREQTVYTPTTLTDKIKEFFGGIGYDPCWAPNATTDPDEKTYIDWEALFADMDVFVVKTHGAERAKAALDLFYSKVRAKDAGKQAVKDRRDIQEWFHDKYVHLSGHVQDWPDRSFCNPPYGDRGPHASLGGFQEFTEAYARAEGSVIMLCPVRSHRKWWRKNVLFTSDAVCFLDPIKFEGFQQSFPAPLCLAYRGPDPEGFKEAFELFGDTDVRGKQEEGCGRCLDVSTESSDHYHGVGWCLDVSTESSDHYHGVGWWDHEPTEEEVWEYMHENMGDLGYPSKEDETPDNPAALMDYVYKGKHYTSYAYPEVVYVGKKE